jgi:hypothetical protein
MRLAVVLVALLPGAGPTHAGSIGVYASANGTGCSIDLPLGVSATLYVVAHTFPNEPAGGTIASGEFRIVGLPTGWMALPSVDPGVHFALGSPFMQGWRFAFASLQDGVIPLLTIQMLATTSVNNVRLDVVQHVDPSPPFGGTVECPWLQFCDNPCDTGATCVDGVSFFINAGGCAVNVEGFSWSQIRSVYR